MKQNNILRILVSLAAIVVPFVLLYKGIYGSLLFSFSVPLLWQVGIRGKTISTLGLQRKYLWRSVITGMIAGIVLALICGKLLQVLGMTGFVLTDSQKYLGFTLNKELSYRLLTGSDSLQGTLLYLLFSVFVIGLGEELFWRGLIQQKIAHWFPRHTAIWSTAVIFGLTHCYVFIILPLQQGVITIAAVTVLGALWGYLFVRFNNIWGPAVCHGIIAFTIWKYYFFTQ